MSPFSSTPKWLRDLQFGFKRLGARLPNRTFSNFAEQQIIDKYVAELGIESRSAVDIGAGDGIRSSNSYHLFLNGWQGIGIEADEDKFERLSSAYAGFKGVTAVHSLVSPSNISNILAGHNVETEPGLVSLDIDGNDYWVLDALLSQYRPRLIVSEYNEKIPPPLKFVVDHDDNFYLRHHFFGYSIAKLADLLAKHNYVLIDAEYNNVFIAPAETASHIALTPVEAYNKGYAQRADRREKFPDNENMERLQTLSAEEGIEFLNDFYRDHRGKYQLGL